MKLDQRPGHPISMATVGLFHAYVLAGSFLVSPWVLLVGVVPITFTVGDYLIRGK